MKKYFIHPFLFVVIALPMAVLSYIYEFILMGWAIGQEWFVPELKGIRMRYYKKLEKKYEKIMAGEQDVV